MRVCIDRTDAGTCSSLSWSPLSSRGESLRYYCENIFWHERNEIEISPRCIDYRVDDGGGRAIHREFSNSLSAVRSMDIAHFFKVDANRGYIGRSRHDVICHLTVLHASILPDDFFVQGKSDPLGYAAGDLSFRKQRVEHSSDLLQR